MQQQRNILGLLTVAVVSTVGFLHRESWWPPTFTMVQNLLPKTTTSTPSTTPVVSSTNPTPENPTTPIALSTPTLTANSQLINKIAVEKLNSTYAIQSGREAGSGFLVKPGIVATNRHVIGDNDTVTLKNLGTYKECQGTVIKRAAERDLAFIKLTEPCEQFTPLTLALTNQLKIGDPVVTVGNPYNKGLSLSVGELKEFNKPYRSQRVGDQIGHVSTALIQPGNSGGALFNAKGEVVGVNSGAAKDLSHFLAIPADFVKEEMATL